jgi:hypothetical protein
MKRLSTTTSLLACLCALTETPAAHAQAGEKASAEALFDQGVSLVAAGNYSDGCTKFEASQALEPTLGTELHLADCYERAGKTASAWALFKESEGLAHRQNEAERAELSRVRAAALAPKLAYLEIDTTGQPPAGFVVHRNGHDVPLGSLGAAIPVDPGPQEVTATAPSRQSWSARIEVPSVPGTVTLSIPRLSAITKPSAVPVRRDPNRDDGAGQRAVGIAATTVGFVGLLAGVGLGLYAKHENDQSQLDRYCPTDAHNGCTSAGVDLRQRAEHFASASTVTLVTGGAVLAGGLLLWSTTPSKSERQSASRLRLTATGGPGSLRTVLGGTW